MKKTEKWYKKPSNWITILLCLILIPILIMNIYIMYQSKVNEDKVPSVFGYKPFIVLSGSMETEIRKGDLIITKEIDPTTLKVNDVIAFRDDQNTVTTHRIIEIEDRDGETYFITKGDNNNSQDQKHVELNDVEGIYVARVAGVGNIMNKLSETSTIIIIILIITIIFILGFLISSKKQRELEMKEFKEYKKMKEAKEKQQEESDKKE
ncbi:MAG: signal peptidase I [Bacilli bacterium]|nr:signal peptidase I [Bacilli bacterium]